MRLKYVVLFVLLNFISCINKHNQVCFNFDFETIQNSKFVGWVDLSNFESIVSIDSTTVYGGKYSMLINNIGIDNDYKIFVYPIYEVYEGDEITLTGYIKTENISPNGFAGLYISLEPQVSEETMYTEKINRTNDWTEYKISMKYIPSKTSAILIGGILVGNGKMWLDDIHVKINGKDIADLNPLNINKKIDKINESTYNKEKYNKISEDINDYTINSLELLARIWGFLKYNHPNIANGSYDWDKELLEFMPSYIETTDLKERDEVLLEWINKFGVILPYIPLNNTTYNSFSNPDFNWINNASISSALKNKLTNIYNYRHQGGGYIIM